MDRYSARINLHGSTQRERAKNRLINELNRKVSDNLSYKDVLLNGNETKLIINSGTQKYYKEFQSLPGQEINIGDYIEWANSHWLVTSCDSDDEIYSDGMLKECNYLLKWQNAKGEIVERWAVIQSASKYNDGTDSNEIISLGSDQLSVAVPLDKESLSLKKNMGIRFFIDNNKETPTAYELTGTGNVPDTYRGHGVTSWIVKECDYTPTIDDLKYGVCDYRIPENIQKHIEIPNESAVSHDVKISISGNRNLRVGIARTYTVIFTDRNGIELNPDKFDFNWNVKAGFEIIPEIDGQKITLQINDESVIGEDVELSVTVYGDEVAHRILSVTDLA